MGSPAIATTHDLPGPIMFEQSSTVTKAAIRRS
jgi:hypothetical protein